MRRRDEEEKKSLARFLVPASEKMKANLTHPPWLR
jgi:hypothetical protein